MSTTTITFTKEIDINMLHTYPMYIIRALAREIGVQSPTSKRINQLVTEINEIITHKREPYFSKTGRPPKTINVHCNLNALADSSMKSKLNKLTEDYNQKLQSLQDGTKEAKSKLKSELIDVVHKLQEIISML